MTQAELDKVHDTVRLPPLHVYSHGDFLVYERYLNNFILIS